MDDFWAWNNAEQQQRLDELVRQKILTPVRSLAHYSSLVKEAKATSLRRSYTNCYLMPSEIERLAALGSLYLLRTDHGLAFVDNESEYYYLFIYADLDEDLSIPQLDRPMLAENVFYEGRRTEQQDRFETMLKSNGFLFHDKYYAIVDRMQEGPEEYWKRYRIAERELSNSGKRVTIPTYAQLQSFETIFRQEIDRYTRKRYTEAERRQHADKGFLHCLTDDDGKIYVVQITANVHGGAIASIKESRMTIDVPCLSYMLNKPYYEAMPVDPDARAKYMKRNSVGGWISVGNKTSWRLHKLLHISKHPSGKAMDQFVLPGFAE